VGPIADLDDVEERKFLTLPGLELRPLSSPTRSQSLSGFEGKRGKGERVCEWKKIDNRKKDTRCHVYV
jgi:hypothetical protein